MSALNVLVYLFLVGGAIRARRAKARAAIKDIGEAFQLLETSLHETFPDLPQGFTWNEAFVRLKSLGLSRELDWWEIENTLKKYEAFRYGGIEYSTINVPSILRLANSLPRGVNYYHAARS